MKKLLIALAAAATAVVASAEIKNQLGFEGDDGTAYANDADAPSVAANYPFASFGDKYLELDESYTPAAKGGNILDVYIQFVACDEACSLEEGEKLGVYVDKEDDCLVVVGSDVTKISKVVTEGWHRLTVVPSGTADFYVYVDGQKVQNEPFAGAGEDNSISEMEFKGSGKLDNFVARTTNPFYDGSYAASVGTGADNEKYATYSDALADVLSSGATDEIKIAGETPRTVDGTAANPYEITNLADLQALANAVNAGKSADKCFVQTADIDMSEAGAFAGIGAYDANPTKGKPFTGTYDGGNFKISNVTMTGRNYGGIFNQVNGGTIKNLTVENISTAATSGEFGYAIVGNAGNGATLQNLTAMGSFLSSEKPGTHNMAGIVVRVCGGGENGTLIKNCTNNAAIYGAYTKMAGICAIAQHKVDGGPVTFDGCSNTGTLTMPSGSTAGRDGLAGIIGYVNDDTVLKGCSNTGSMTSTLATAKVGQLVGWAYDHELTDGGDNAARADAKMLAHQSPAEFENDKGETHYCTVTGFQYATVANGVATTVTTLAKGGAYLLESNIAASATPVFTFTEAGTISFDAALGYTFEGTVAADTSRIASLDSATVDNVTTYMAVAGVASVGGQAYATLQDAIDNAGDNDVITILPGIDTTQRYNVFNRGGTFKFAYDTDYIALFMNGLLTADGFILQGMPVTESEDTVLVYSVVEGVAKMNSTWYASFESAYYAAPGSGATLLVKVDSDFTPTFPQASQNEVLKEFASVTFTTTSEEPIAIATSDGTTFIKSQNWSAPETATLTLASQTIASVATGTLNIPEGTTLAVASGASFANVGAITGAGVLSAVGLNPVTALQTDHVAALLADSAKWTGVVVLGNVSLGNDSLDYYGNVNSTVRLSNVDVNSLVIAGRSNNVKSLDVAGNGLTFNELAANTTIPCALTGDGSIVVKGSAAQQKVLSFTGDCSEFAGSLTIDSANGVAKVLFGTKDTAGNGSCLTVGSDASVKVASGKTWTVPGGYVINGSVKADGALNTADKIYGSGTITSTVAQTSKVGSSWSGTYNICWAGNNTTGISFDWYGQAKSKIVIPANHTLQGYIAVTANQSLTLAAGEFVVDGVLNLSNGYDYSTVGWKKISGSGTLKFAFAPSHWIKEKIEKLDGFTGSIEVSTTTQLEIAGVRVAAAPEAGARVVPITVNGNGTVGGDLKLYVGDEVQDVTLEFKADGAEGSGIYVAEPPAAKVAEIVDGEQYETLAEALAAATDGATVKLLADITLDARVEPNLGAGTALTIDLGGYTITREGTGGNGSAFDVKSGTVVIKNGTIDCTQDDTAIVKDGVYAITARSGAAVTLDGLTVKVNSQAGACAYPFAGATLAITSGTYRNNTAEPYQYKTGWTGMAVNQANVEQQLITISGGSFYQVNPAEGDDSGKVTSFLAANCESTYDSATGFWTVAEKQGFPGGADGKTFTIDTAVQAALAEKIPEGKALTDAVEGTTSGVTYAQAYALGLLDETTGELKKDVTPTIEVKGGKVVVSLDANAKDAYKVTLTVYESTSLNANATWLVAATYELDSKTEAEGFTPADDATGFYKVGVTIEDKDVAVPSGN